MDQRNSKILRRKKIRKILLINSDNEMKKKIKAKNYVLINSMTPEELVNLFQLYKNPINIPISTFTNIVETHIIEKIVDINNNIEYYCSDLIDNKKEKIKKKYLYQQLYSTKNFIVNYDNLFNDNKEDKKDKDKEDNHHNGELGSHIIPFVSKKKIVGEEKIKNNNNTYPLISIVQKNINIEEDVKNSSCECNSNNKAECFDCNEKKKDKKRLLDLNHKLIYYCYTHLKRKRPLIQKKSDNTTILGLEIEEEIFTKNKNNAVIKKNKHNQDIGKNINSVKIKTKDINNINTKEFDKKRNSVKIKNRCHHNLDVHNQNNNLDMENEKKMLKRLGKKFLSLRSETNNKRENILFSQNTVKSKKLGNSNIKGHKSINENKRFKRNTLTQNIISKADTKNSSFDNLSSEKISSLNKNKKRLNIIHFLKKKVLINSSNKKNKHNKKSKIKNENEKNEKVLTRKNFKFLTQHRIKNESPEEIKIDKGKTKKHKKTNDPVRCKMFCFLQGCSEFNQLSDFKENKIKYIQNNIRSSINKMKSFKCKSKKDCLNYEENLDDENHIFIERIKSNESINKYLKKNKRQETYNLKKTNYK